MKKLTMLIVLVVLSVLMVSNVVFAEGDIDLSIDYTAEMLYEKAVELVERYPEVLRIEVIGHSVDQRPIFVLQLTSDVDIMASAELNYTSKYHFLVEGGIHSRENVAAPMLLKIMETYAKDYYDDSVLPSIRMTDLLEDNVLHIIPLSNPDGYTLANFGIDQLSQTYQNQLMSFQSHEFSNYKSNVNGVDLNRNFPGDYYDINNDRWLDIWNREHNQYHSNIPGSGFYFGPYPGSEAETKALMAYLLKYDFRNYVSYHSKGEVIYYYKWMLSNKHNAHTRDLVDLLSIYTSYRPIFTDQGASSSGYLTDYTAMRTLKPSITLETVSSSVTLPADNDLIQEAYDKNIYAPILAIQLGKRIGYFDYKLYVDGLYVRDYEEVEYAEAWADKLGGQLLKYEGKPIYHLSESILPISREHAVTALMLLLNPEVTELTLPFLDCKEARVTEAKTLGIVSGYQNRFFPEKALKFEEAYVIIAKAFDLLPSESTLFYEVKWAEQAMNQLFDAGLISFGQIHSGPMMKKDFDFLLEQLLNVNNSL